MRGGSAGNAQLPAAGMPWFMTVFGRDTLITSYQTLLLGPGPRPRRARGARRAPGDRGRRRRSTPSRARSSTRCATARPRRPGSDATTGRSTRRRSTSCCSRRSGAGPATTRSSTACASRRCARSDGSTRSTGSSHTSARTERGLENQSWKDSGDSQRFARRARRAASDRAGRGAGVRVRREAPDGRARPRGLGRCWARRPAGARCRRSAAALRRGVLDGRALRARARPRRRARRLALLERRPSALERDRPGRAGRRGRRGADGRRALVGLGHPHDVRPTTAATTRSRTTTEPSGPTTIP